MSSVDQPENHDRLVFVYGLLLGLATTKRYKMSPALRREIRNAASMIGKVADPLNQFKVPLTKKGK
jgi:hypothetical protein